MQRHHLLDGVFKEVHKPDQGVLVHRLNVGQLRDVEEEDCHMASHWLVPETCFINLRGKHANIRRSGIYASLVTCVLVFNVNVSTQMFLVLHDTQR